MTSHPPRPHTRRTTMISDISNIISLVFASLIPESWGWNALVRMQVSMVLAQFAQSALATVVPKLKFLLNLFQANEIVIYNKGDETSHHQGGNQGNHLYARVEEHLVRKYMTDIKAYELKAACGNADSMSLSIYDMLPATFTVKTDAGAAIRVSIGAISEKERRRSIRFTSKLPIPAIQAYIKSIATTETVSNVMTIYRTHTHTTKDKDSRTVEWVPVYMKTNKTYTNTIYSEGIHKELFEDVKYFMENEKEWSRRGIDYKRGYLLHGLPGTGKTSVAKILANMYGLPVFLLDVANLCDEQMVSLCTEINYYTHNKRYILLMEDLDRTAIFDTDRYGRRPSIQAFLNVLDGMLNPFGRLLFITGNDVSVFRTCPAAFRPGRIDKEIEFGHCTPDQMRRLVTLFYDEDATLPADNVLSKTRITPAELVKMMQANPTNVDELLSKLIVHESSASLEDVDAGILGSGLGSRRRTRRSISRKRTTPLTTMASTRRLLTLAERVDDTVRVFKKATIKMSVLESLKERIKKETEVNDKKVKKEAAKNKKSRA